VLIDALVVTVCLVAVVVLAVVVMHAARNQRQLREVQPRAVGGSSVGVGVKKEAARW
jgi:hypothetical protein